MVKCENCLTREAGLRLEGLVNGRQGTHLYCRECADDLMRRTAGAEEDSAGAAVDPRGAPSDEGTRRNWEYCLIDRSIPDVSPSVVFIEGGSRRVEQVVGALEQMAVLGAEGWELVGIEVMLNTPTDPDRRLAVPGPSVSGSYYWFKRPKN
jgi:hypothetical protein